MHEGAGGLEAEVKILEVDRDAVIAALTRLGAVRTFDGTMHALYLDLPGGPLGARQEAFRLRQEGERAVLTLKRPVENEAVKVREEIEVEVSDFTAMRGILAGLGFSVWLEMKKHRTTYEFEGLHFDLDRHEGAYSYIPEFLEIEGSNPETVFRYAELLGFSRKDCRPWDAVQVAAFYRDREPRG